MNSFHLFITYLAIIAFIVILLTMFSEEHRETFASPAAKTSAICPPPLSTINNDALSLTYSADPTMNNSQLKYCANLYIMKCNGTNTRTAGGVTTKTNNMQITNTNNKNLDTNTVYFNVTGTGKVVNESTLTALPT